MYIEASNELLALAVAAFRAASRFMAVSVLEVAAIVEQYLMYQVMEMSTACVLNCAAQCLPTTSQPSTNQSKHQKFGKQEVVASHC
jgi:hypothetical protein